MVVLVRVRYREVGGTFRSPGGSPKNADDFYELAAVYIEHVLCLTGGTVAVKCCTAWWWISWAISALIHHQHDGRGIRKHFQDSMVAGK